MATKRPMSAEITAELLEAFNEYVTENRYIKYRAIEAAFKLFMAAPETLQLKLMREDAVTTDLVVNYNDKPAGGSNSKKRKYSVDISKGDGSEQAVSIDKKDLAALEGVIKQIVKDELDTPKNKPTTKKSGSKKT